MKKKQTQMCFKKEKDGNVALASPKTNPQSVMFVCLGNIIRSPLCEGLFRKLTNGQIKVNSSAVTSYNLNEHPAFYSQEIARSNGFDISSHISKMITKDDFQSYDLIVSLEPYVTHILEKRKPPNFNGKIIELLKGTRVQNPYGMPKECFVSMYNQIETGINLLIKNYFPEYATSQ